MEVPIWRKVTLTFEEAAAYSNIGIGRLRELAAEPNCDFILHVGNRRLIKRVAFEKFISTSFSV